MAEARCPDCCPFEGHETEPLHHGRVEHEIGLLEQPPLRLLVDLTEADDATAKVIPERVHEPPFIVDRAAVERLGAGDHQITVVTMPSAQLGEHPYRMLAVLVPER